MARDPKDLRCWQLAHALRVEVNRLCQHQLVARDFKFCNGFRDAAGSVCRNLAEGFVRFESGWIVQFFGYALASLAELIDYLHECELRGVLDDKELERLLDRAEHVKATTTNFMKPHIRKARDEKKGSQRRKTSRAP